MDGLIDLVLENPLFLIILIGGIVSLFKGKSEQAEESESTTNKPKPRSVEDLFERAHQRERTRSTEKVRTEPISSKTIEELREEQMLRFAGQADDDEDQQKNDEYTSRSSNRIMEENTKVNHKKQAFKQNFNKSLTRKGLVNSVIMAEVLGAPRARKPYQSVITKRRNG
ncbi:MAG TPA: hypothetical protein VK135_04690 [Candidatus Dormibacteraeota bacterium]|nr:hypothetical protein [Candidatus Dormibacteraeota bacterium]